MNLQKNIPLKNYSNFKIGGSAKYFVEISSVSELKEAITFAKEQELKIYILGKATKVLIGDEGFDGIIIYNKIRGIEKKGEKIRVGSGVLIKNLLDYCVGRSLSGLEWAGGLPGTVGGAVRGNAGAFGGEIKDNIVEVESIDLDTLVDIKRKYLECKFAYRDSVFKSGEGRNEFIAFAVFDTKPGEKVEIAKAIQDKINSRESHQPLDFPSVGSTFKNIPFGSLPKKLQEEFRTIIKNDPFPVVPVTKILAKCNLKGKKMGGAMFSEKQTNFIVNTGNAIAKDVSSLIDFAKQEVMKKYNIVLEEEIVFLN
jgi:UDP-N-acetylmuramate dehydrogenase